MTEKEQNDQAANEGGVEEGLSETDAASENPEAQDSAETIDESTPAADLEATQEITPPDPDEAPAEEPPAPADAQPQVIKKGGVIGWLGLLLALLAVGGVGFLYYQLMYLTAPEQTQAQIESLEQTTSSAIASADREREQAIADLRLSQSEALSTALAEVDERLQSVESGVAQSLGEALNAAPPSEREWKLAEAAYLLRLANHRVLMEQDARSALTMVEAADAIIADLDDFSLHAVRAALADEIMALRRVRGADVQGVYLTIEAIKNQLGQMPIAIPEYLVREPEPEPVDDRTVWQIITDRFFDLFAFQKTTRDGIGPLLAPDQRDYLEQNIRLTLEQAQLAALKRDQAVYETALTNARDWVNNYLRSESDDVQQFVATLNELLAIDLAKALPDISQSLLALQAIMRGEVPEDAAPVEPPPEPVTQTTEPEVVSEVVVPIQTAAEESEESVAAEEPTP